MIPPVFGPQYYSENNQTIKKRIDDFYAQATTLHNGFWGEAFIDTQYEAGDQVLNSNSYGVLPAWGRKQLSFNHIRPTVNVVDGYQRRNRKSTIVVPVENGDSETADQFTKILMWINRNEGVLETISDSFHGSLVTGLSFLHVWLDYRTDPVSGNIRVDHLPYNSFIMDPFWKKADLSDCRQILYRQYKTKRDLISYYPDFEEAIAQIPENDGSNTRDGRFQFTPEAQNFSSKGLLAVDEFYYRDYRTQLMLVDSLTGETMPWMGKSDEGLQQFLKNNKMITTIEQIVPTVNLAVKVQDLILFDGPQPSGIDDYPMIPVFCYYNPQMSDMSLRIQGMVRGMRDAQYLYNRRKIIELDIFESQPNSGFIYKEDSLVDPLDVYQQQGQGKGIALKKDAQMSDVQQIQPPRVDASMFTASQILSEEMPIISGVTKELAGMSGDAKSGLQEMWRTAAGKTGLEILFDHLDRAQKLLGNRMISMIQANFTPGKVQKILEGQKPADQFYSKAFGIYGCAVEEGFNTTTQKQLEFAQLMQLREAGIPIPDKDILEVATLQGKKTIIQDMEQAQQQNMQQSQEAHQLAMAEIQAKIKASDALAVANQGLGVERLSRVEENEALAIERRAAAEKDHDMALLNLVKAIKEVDGIDIEHVAKLLSLSQLMKTQQPDTQLQPEAPSVPANEFQGQPMTGS
jgi:hypothetical protein